MEKLAQYIQRVEIGSLWSGRKHIVWDLVPGVNILSGVNGVGKSTILNRIEKSLSELNRTKGISIAESPNIKLTLFPADATKVNYSTIRSFDATMLSGSILETLAGGNVRSELDWHIYELQRRYLNYQVDMGNRMIQLLSSGSEDARQQALLVSQAKTEFQDMVDELYKETKKRIDRNSNELQFIQYDEVLLPYQLSSGEKQLLIILLTVLLQEQNPCILLMDEPEISMHIEWQQKLVEFIRKLNPQVQIILTTHSPALIMNGWIDSVVDVSDITTNE